MKGGFLLEVSYRWRLIVNPIRCVLFGHIPTEIFRCYIAPYAGGPSPNQPSSRFIGCGRQGCNWRKK